MTLVESTPGAAASATGAHGCAGARRRSARRAVAVALFLAAAPVSARADWVTQKIDVPARVFGITTDAGEVRINSGGLWYRLAADSGAHTLTFIDVPNRPPLPNSALPEGRVVTGTRDIARAWFADPTDRYGSGVLGGKPTAASVVIETREGKRFTVHLGEDSVFADLAPRLADLDGDGHDEVIVVKASLAEGAELAVIGLRQGRYAILAETPPDGEPHHWLDPAGIADFNGDGKIDIALVRRPHTAGRLELWTWTDKHLRKTGELADVSNHVAGSAAIDMSAVTDIDGDGIADLVIPSVDRARLRFVSFVPSAHEIASVALPATAATNIGLVETKAGKPAFAVGLSDGSLVLVRGAGP